jgi:hypothetical protein
MGYRNGAHDAYSDERTLVIATGHEGHQVDLPGGQVVYLDSNIEQQPDVLSDMRWMGLRDGQFARVQVEGIPYPVLQSEASFNNRSLFDRSLTHSSPNGIPFTQGFEPESYGPSAALSETYRVLEPGGTLRIVTGSLAVNRDDVRADINSSLEALGFTNIQI